MAGGTNIHTQGANKKEGRVLQSTTRAHTNRERSMALCIPRYVLVEDQAVVCFISDTATSMYSIVLVRFRGYENSL